MVKGVKQSVKKTVGRTTLDYDELRTAVMEIEAIINARPLTYVSDDEESLSSPVTPSHLINDRRVAIAPNNQHFEIVLDKESEASPEVFTAVYKSMVIRVSFGSARTCQ